MDLIDSLLQLDTDILRALNHAGDNAVLDALMVAFTIIGISYVIGLIAIPLWRKGKREAAFDVVLLVIVVTVITEIIKLLVDRPRPVFELSGVQTILSASGPAFPSAHASRAFAVAFLVAMTSNRVWGAIGFVIAFLIGLSRVYLGVHWPSDVLFGAALGLLLAAMLFYIAGNSELYRDFRKKMVDRIAAVFGMDQEPRRAASDRAVET